MGMTRKEVKAYIDDPNNWAVIPGNEFVQCAVMEYWDLHIIQIQHKHDENAWKRATKYEDTLPKLVWQTGTFWIFDPETRALLYTISRTELENKIYSLEKEA